MTSISLGISASAASLSDDMRNQTWRAVISSSIGNALEWFEIIFYSAFAPTIAKLFFPASDESVSLMITFATLGVTFLMRPLGAVILGAYADRAGRKAASCHQECAAFATKRTPSAVQTRLTVSNRGALPGRNAL